MPKQSAGLLLYRIREKHVEVFLVHPGGPFWAKKDAAAWSIPKGEFTDGEDAKVIMQGKTVAEVVSEAGAARVPVYLIRVNYNKELCSVIPDATWRVAVESTGGRFYAAAEEGTILRAIGDIDRAAIGRIDIKQYVTQHPRFAPFALVAAAMWTLALTLKLWVPYFRRFP